MSDQPEPCIGGRCLSAAVATLGVGVILAAMLLGFGFYSMKKFDQLTDQVDDLPRKIGTNLHEISQTLQRAQ